MDRCPACGGQLILVARHNDYRSPQKTNRYRCARCRQIVERPVETAGAKPDHPPGSDAPP